MSGSGNAYFQVDSVECRVVDYNWSFEGDNQAQIAAHWQKVCSEKPGTFDGRVFLSCGWSVVEEGSRRILHSQHFETGYSAFLYWHACGCPGDSISNSFAAAAVRGGDGGYLVGEMGAHTTNAGQLYFACGTPDKADECAGQLDFRASVFRELEEETGLAPPLVRAGDRWTIIDTGSMLACLLDVSSVDTVSQLACRARAFIASESQPELADVRCIAHVLDIAPALMPAYMQMFFASAFAGDADL